MQQRIAIYPDSESLSQEAARLVIRLAQEAIVTHGRFTLALAGGSTPRKLYSLLASDPYRGQIDWTRVDIFWSDERCVPPDHPESNYRMAYEVMLSKLPIPAANIHRMPAEQADRQAAAESYAAELRRVFGTAGVPVFDLIQLGMGPEGHTASLFPHQAALHERERLVLPVSVPKPPPERLTFTPPILQAARHILFLVTGSDKAEAVRAVLEDQGSPDDYPARLVHAAAGEVAWLLDTAAAAALQRRSTA
ncbi:MAG: 6-phosphogluconolactonase [Thermogemmatispora sp.]|jgi:6-phosphogluconolactonase|uniref:6-phosphogluconolactonase n=1 Tax=Thermogemmatispora sp. TaxID=1968838 RepID=UPI001A0BF331|nr:6-phosphogluconolactonase [Thermogemmatispora sp.]MBE3564849.1 6-phosphogluconolactonase [Thermogemmatispora sp.]